MSNMEEYATTMKQLLLSRTNRGIFRDIKKLDHDVLIDELTQRGCNMHGSRSILEERLLRAKLREEPTLRQIVPWFEFDIEGAEEREPVTMREPLPKRKRTSKQVAPEKQVHFCDERGSDGVSVAHRKRMIVQAEVHAPPPNGRRSGAAAQQPVAVDEYRQTIPRQPLQSREKFVVPDQQLMMDKALYKIVQDGDYQYRAFSRRTQTMPMQVLAGEHTQQTVPTFSKPPVPRPRRCLCMLERSRQNELNAENETRQTSRENNNAPRQHHQSAIQTQPVVGTNRASNAPQYSVPRVNVNDRNSRGDARRNHDAESKRALEVPAEVHTADYIVDLSCLRLDNRRYVTVAIAEKLFPALVDSGATKSVVGERVYRSCYRFVKPTKANIRYPNGQVSRACGEVILTFRVDGHNASLNCVVVPKFVQDVILGMDFALALDLDVRLGRGYWRVREGKWYLLNGLGCEETCIIAECAALQSIESAQSEQITAVVQKTLATRNKTFSDIGLIGHQIKLKDEVLVRSKLRRMSPKMWETAMNIVAEWYRDGVIERSSSDYCSVPVLIMETDHDSEEVVMTENTEEDSESWIQAINSNEQMIEAISPPLLSLVSSDADSTIEETEVPTNNKARELYIRMSGRASRQEDEVVKQQQEPPMEMSADEKAHEEDNEAPRTLHCDNCGRKGETTSTCPRCRYEHQRFLLELEAHRARERAGKERQSSVNTHEACRAKERAEQKALYRTKVEAARRANAIEDEEKRRRAAAAQAEELHEIFYFIALQ
ncbi:unnamed protein product [Trichogramma brassicae]|uniref:Uncharacterized protein n=1 Tax=Trichogramma brassicae TaxID=86971 RepID=A0A6H5J8Z1_9HYME|nr:unnamed protein product [Trichogramma brassicae]